MLLTAVAYSYQDLRRSLIKVSAGVFIFRLRFVDDVRMVCVCVCVKITCV